eukprot:TRINITY_DN13706_c0_g1_i1.p1 TRINITY_DN13706_c0_g1~~TRINITY_DN13706_c0_g1_i1.p1  ORF type:complete len:483 (-),score=103.52 TRINITY_DN13706_c0_g1_i1:46-1494(-)
MDVFDYLISLPESIFDALYHDALACQAVFRSLPPLAKQYVMRMLFMGTVPVSTVNNWPLPIASSQHKTAVRRLIDLKICHILKTQAASAGGRQDPVMAMHATFRENLLSTLSSIEDHPALSRDGLEPDEHPPSLEFLEKYAQQSWDSVLQWMVGGTPSTVSYSPSTRLVNLLLNAGLMMTGDDGDPHITNQGFKFLLKDINTQMWTLLLEYVKVSMDLKDILSFLFRLTFLRLGSDYPVEPLSKAQKELVNDLVEFGLLYKHKTSSRQYYPTRLAISLCNGVRKDAGPADLSTLSKTNNALSDRLQGTEAQEAEGYIIVESNYRVYAYTSSPLKIALLSMFVALQYRLPNLAVGIITRESVREALVSGISAEQIITFLSTNAHSQIRKAIAESVGKTFVPGGIHTLVPEVVVDQIRLWESERSRVKDTRAVLYDQFNTAEQYSSVLKYAGDMGVLLWHSDDTQMIMVAEHAHEPIKQFIKKH